MGDQDPAGIALVEAFGRFCLDQFPQPARMENVAPGQVKPMPADQLRRYLHEDPGHGWYYTANGATYVVTVEDPPYHTCAVRSMYATPPRYRFPWLMRTQTWAAAANRGPFQEGPGQSANRDGMQIEARTRLLPGPTPDMFMEFKTTYPDGRVEERLTRTAQGR